MGTEAAMSGACWRQLQEMEEEQQWLEFLDAQRSKENVQKGPPSPINDDILKGNENGIYCN